jgi:hypothetical protein
MTRMIWIFLLVAAPFTAPAVMAKDLAEQYLDARALYGVETSEHGHFLSAYPERVMDGIDGEWVMIDMLLLGQVAGIEEQMAQGCNGRWKMRIERTGPHAFQWTRQAGPEREMTVIFTALGGASFNRFSDAGELGRYMGFDRLPANSALDMLARANGPATVLRPSDDMLIIHSGHPSMPEMLGRCPS